MKCIVTVCPTSKPANTIFRVFSGRITYDLKIYKRFHEIVETRSFDEICQEKRIVLWVIEVQKEVIKISVHHVMSSTPPMSTVVLIYSLVFPAKPRYDVKRNRVIPSPTNSLSLFKCITAIPYQGTHPR